MKARKIVLAGVLVASAFLVGCSKSQSGSSATSSSSSGAKETLTIKWLSQGTGMNSWEGTTIPIREEFEKQTGIKVEAEFYSFNDLFDVLETRCAAGLSDFDVMSVDVTYVSKYGSSGYLEPLDQYFTAEEKAEWDSASYTAGVWQGTMYAAAENTSTQQLYYNKKLLDEAGITLPENDATHRLTYEQVARLAKQAQDKLDPQRTKGIIGLDFQQVSRVYQMNMLANSMGGKNISDDGYSLDGVVNTKPWIDAMTWYQNLVKDGIASRGYAADQTAEQFYVGNMVFMIAGTWTNANMRVDDEIGSTYAPCFEGHENDVATSTGSWYFGINSKSPKKELAAKFVKFFTLGKGNDMWMEISGQVPSRLALQKELMESDSALPRMKIAAYESANTAYPRAVTPVFGEYSSVLDQAWEDVRNGADVKKTLDNAVTSFASLVASTTNKK